MELVDKVEQQSREGIADSLTEDGHKVTAEEISAQHKFPPNPLQELGGEVVDEVHDLTEFAKATTEGSNYARTTPSSNIVSILKHRLLGKKAA